MKSLEPVFQFLKNTEVVDTGLEFYPNSGKALCISYLFDTNIKERMTFGFLFSEVFSISQKVRNEFNAKELGIVDLAMINFLYQSNYSDDLKRFVFHTQDNFIIVTASSVELIKGLEFA